MWLILGVLIFYVLLILNLSLNLFSWHFKLDGFDLTISLVLLLVLFGCFKLAQYTKGKIEMWLALLVCISLVVFGLVVQYDFYNESVSSGFFARKIVSPYWFRAMNFMVCILPLIFWFSYPYRLLKPNKIR
jgi:hypothetical protein